MRDDYKLVGPTAKISAEVEQGIFEAISAMAEHTGFSVAELTNTALKRFVSGHKDFLPAKVTQPPRPIRKAG